MTRPAEALDFITKSETTRGNSGLFAQVRAHFAKVAAAHARRTRFSRLDQAAGRDLGLTDEEVLGEAAYDAALPFFFQRGFDQR